MEKVPQKTDIGTSAKHKNQRRWGLIGVCTLTVLVGTVYGMWPMPPVPCGSLQPWGATVANGRCIVNSNLRLDSYNPLTRAMQRLPDQLTVKGNLVINGTQINALPGALIVEGDLVLHKTGINKLPGDLSVSGAFDTYGGFGTDAIRCADIPATTVIKGNRGCKH